ncbi:MAG TPA: hypothetical protein VEO54_00730 [Thermoanaerobaculia bacterium]|nr:hypothetical protein [Thermoanaerobaculia bacterium]
MCLLILSTFAAAAGPRTTPAERVSRMSAEERLIRSAYAKMAMYNRADYVHSLFEENAWLADNIALKFQLSDFRSGSLDDIRHELWSDFVTPPTGDVIRGVLRNANYGGQRFFSYPAEWQPGVWSQYDREPLTVANVAALEAEAFHDVAKYTAYSVTVTYQGRSRSYRALAVYHNRYDAANDLNPEFVDNVVGVAGELTTIADVTTLPLDRAPRRVVVQSTGAKVAANSLGCSDEFFHAFDSSDHVVPRDQYDLQMHGADFVFQKCCKDTVDNRHACDVNVIYTPFTERGTVATPGVKHVGVATVEPGHDEKPKTMETKCAGAAAVAVQSCTVTCGQLSIAVKAEWKGFGFSAEWTTAPANAFFSAKQAAGLTCAAQQDTDGGDDDPCEGETPGTALEANYWDSKCDPFEPSPILIDVDGDGYALTGAADGVAFDLDSNRTAELLSWTAAGADDAFLAYDRNGDGAITTGRELFGNYTWQSAAANRNGFIALAMYDRPENGGNADGLMDARDARFASFVLWTDANHNGVSEASELRPLASAGVRAIELDYKESQRTDEYGNAFRYRAKVHGTKHDTLARWAWDVFFVNAD